MKKLNFWHLCLAIWLGMASHSCAQNKTTFELAEDEKLIKFTTDRFTLPNLHVTPDGKSIIFDVLGDIYKVPIEGGKAEVLLQDNHWKRAGKLSPDGKTLAYVSDETGVFQVWTMNLETKEKREYPIKEFVHYPLYSYWRDENNLLIPSKEGLQNFDVTTGKAEIIRSALEEEKSVMNAINRRMSVLQSGRYAFFEKESNLLMFDVNKRQEEFVSEIPYKTYLDHLRVTSDRKGAVFYKINNGYFSTQDLIYWSLSTGETKMLYSTDLLEESTTLNYSFDFIDYDTIILDKEGEIVRMNIETGEYKPIPIEVEVKKIIKKPLRREPQYIRDSIITSSVLRNPVTRKDLDTIYFGTFGKLHSYAKRTKEITEVYPDEDRFEISPSLSPDGKFLAYTTWNDTEIGHVYVREVETGKEYQMTQTSGRYINPAWSPDGTEIVFVADETEAKMGIPRQSGGTNTRNYHLDIHKLKILKNNNVQEYNQTDTISRVYPVSIVPRRFYSIPVYHPNGKSIFITTRNHEKDLPALIEVDIETKAILQERLIPFHTDEVIISPNAQYIAFIFDEQVWIDVFPHALKLNYSENSEFISEGRHYKGGYVENILLPEAKSVYEIAPSYLFWQDERTLMWGSAEEVYIYDVRTGETEKIADIKVQKPRAVPKAQYALTNARIITMNKEDEIIEKGTILVKDNRIETVGEVEKIVIPKNYKVFNLEGKTIIPGLIDVHAHYHHFPHEFQVQQNYKYMGNLAYGVTTIYDPSVNVLDYREQAQMVETGQVIGPRVFASGNIIMNGAMQYDYKNNLTQEDSDRILKSYSKLNVSGPIKEYDNRNRRKRRNLRTAAKKYNLSITSHQNSFIESMCRIIDGYTAIEHEIGGFGLKTDAIKFIGYSTMNYTPTFIVSPLIGGLYMDKTILENKKLTSLNGNLLYNKYIAKRQNEIDSSMLLKNKKDIRRASSAIKDIMSYNGIISVGGHGNPLPGIGTHWELWAFTYDNGLTNYEALKTATMNGAEKLDLQEEIGTVEAGKLADMVILNINPLDDIFNTVDIFYTVKNGVIFESKDMREACIID